jgi:hypothetical protein
MVHMGFYSRRYYCATAVGEVVREVTHGVEDILWT